MLSRDEIDRKCKVQCNGVCDLLEGHDGPHRSSNLYVIKPIEPKVK